MTIHFSRTVGFVSEGVYESDSSSTYGTVVTMMMDKESNRCPE